MIEAAAAALWTLLVFVIGYGVSYWLHARQAVLDARSMEALADLYAEIIRKQSLRLAKFARRKGAMGRFVKADDTHPLPCPSDRIAA